MARVFISHASGDADAARDLFAWLSSQGFDRGFLDIDTDQGIPPGAKWEQMLYDELERAQAVILLLTRNWFDSKWCFAEFAQARSRGKAIFPVIIGPGGDQYIGDDLQKLDLTHDRTGGLDRLSRRLTEVALTSQSGFDFPAGRAPYPGFLAFDEDDAAIYFGRDDDVRRLIQRLDSRRIEGGKRFVLVLGESGTGKSSLLRAGLVPRLKRAKRDWIALPVFRPGDDPFMGLAASLRAAGADVLSGDLADADVEKLAVAIAAKSDAHQAAILVPIDQMEELFTRTPAARSEQFLAFLSKMLGPGLPFVATATMRSDHLGNMQAAPGLGTEFEPFNLPPLPLERIGEIVRGPARIAGLEVDESLVARITQDAETTDALPLVAFALRRLYDRFGGDGRLQLVEYESLRDAAAGLSPLETVVRDTAAGVIDDAKPDAEELKALREAFVPDLVKVNDEGGFVRQAAGWDALPEKSHRLVAALAGAGARLLVVRDKEGGREVEVAHEALFRVWPLLVGWLVEEKEFLIGRNRLEKALADWQALDEAERAKGLISGILLDRAGLWLTEHPGRFSAEETAFIHASQAAEQERQRQEEEQRQELQAAKLREAEIERDAAHQLTRRTRLAAAILGVVALVAVGAGVYALIAERHANHNLDIAKSTVDKVVFDVAQGLRNSQGVRIETMRAILGRVEDAMSSLSDAAPGDRDVQRSRSVMLDDFGDTYLAAGDGAAALKSYEASLAIQRKLVALDPKNPDWQRDVSLSLDRIGNVKAANGDAAGARAAYSESLAMAEVQAKANPDNVERQRDLSIGLQHIGDLDVTAGDNAGALKMYGESLAIARKLAAAKPDNGELQRDVAVVQTVVGDVERDMGDSAAALAAYEEGLAIRRKAAASDPGNTQSQRDVIVGLTRIGDLKRVAGDTAAALAAFEEALVLARKLAASDPANVTWQRDVSVALERIAQVEAATGDNEGARAAYEEGLAIARKVAATDPTNLDWQRDILLGLAELGGVKAQAKDTAGAIAAYDDSLAIARKLVAADPSETTWQRDVAATLNSLGDIKLASNDAGGALAAYQESIDIGRKLAASDASNTVWQRDVAVDLNKLGDARMKASDTEGARAAYGESLGLVRKLAATDAANTTWQRDLIFGLNRSGDADLAAGDKAAALAAYEEGVGIGRRLAGLDAGNVTWQTDLVIGLWKAQSVSADGSERKAMLDEAAGVLQGLADKDKLPAAAKELDRSPQEDPRRAGSTRHQPVGRIGCTRQKQRRRRFPAGAACPEAWEVRFVLADTLVDQVDEAADGRRRYSAGAGVEVEAGHLVLGRHHALHDRHEALQIEQLVEGGRNVAGLQAVDSGRCQIDTADDDVAGLLAGLLQDLGKHAGDAAVLGADRLQVRMALDVGHQNRDGERRIGVDLLGDLQAVDFEAGLLQRVGEALLGLAALGLAEHAIDHRLVAGLEALIEHVLGRERATGIEVDAGIAHALGLELVLQRGHRRVADGHHDALVDGALDDVMERGGARVAHDLDAVRLGGNRLLELVDHGLRRPGRELRLQLDAESRSGLSGAGLTGERRSVAGVAAHLHVHDQAFADRIGGRGHTDAGQQRRCGHAGQQQFRYLHSCSLPPDLHRARRRVPLFSRAGAAEILGKTDARKERPTALRLIDIEVEDDRDHEDEALNGAHPGAGQAGGDQARLNHADYECAEDGADDRGTAAEDRCAADQHRGDGGQQIALALIAEEILVLERQHDRGGRGQSAHQGEDLDLLQVDVDADDPRNVVGIADEQRVLAEAVAVQDEPQEDHDDRGPQRLQRQLMDPVRCAGAGKGTADDPLPHRALLGATQGIGLAAREHGRHAVPEELGGERRHEGGDADLGDEDAVDEADHHPGAERDDHCNPAEIVFLEQDGEDESRKADDRWKTQIDLSGADDERQPDGEQDQRRQRRKEGRIDERPQEDLRRRVHEQAEQQHEDDDDRQALDAEDDGFMSLFGHWASQCLP